MINRIGFFEAYGEYLIKARKPHMMREESLEVSINEFCRALKEKMETRKEGKMSDSKEFFERFGHFYIHTDPSGGSHETSYGVILVEDLYQAFEERRKAEAKEEDFCLSATEQAILDKGDAILAKRAKAKCKHGHEDSWGRMIAYYKDIGDKHCRDCGEKLWKRTNIWNSICA